MSIDTKGRREVYLSPDRLQLAAPPDDALGAEVLTLAHASQLPRWLTRLGRVETLIFYRPELDELPPWLAEMGKVAEVVFQYAMPARGLRHLAWPTLRRLRLYEVPADSLPDDLARLSRLELLDLERSEMTSLPDWIGELRELRVLSLDQVPLASIPASLLTLPALTTLQLATTRVESLPGPLDALTHLEWLSLRGASARQALPQLARLPHLHSLALHDSGLRGDQLALLGALRRLRSLTLIRQPLGTVPGALFELPRLESLQLSQSPAVLPDALGPAPCLRELWLDRMQLATLPAALGRLPALEKLDVTGNLLVTLPDSLGQSRSLRWLDARSNRIEHVPASLHRLLDGGTLMLAFNRIADLPPEFEGLPLFVVTGNPVTGKPDFFRESHESFPCESCGLRRMRSIGGTTVHGNLSTPASNSEVEMDYRCQSCGHAMTRLV